MLEFVLKQIVGVLVGCITTYLWNEFRRYKEKQEKINEINTMELEAMKGGLQALLRDRIIQSYNYYIEKGWIPIYAKDSVNNCFANYEKLGANGVICDIMKQINDLPNHKIEDGK